MGAMQEFILLKLSVQIDPCWLYLFGVLLVLVNLYKWVKLNKWGRD